MKNEERVMKNVIIAAGYATRLGELTRNFPKSLLPIGNSTILNRLLDDIDTIPDIDEHIIISNHKFIHIFEEWKEKQRYIKPITLVDDGTETNETRLGAVRDLLLAIDRYDIQSDMLVMAADNLLDFSLKGFVDYANAKGTSCIMCHCQPDIEKLHRTGVIEVDGDMKVLSMEEKPQQPKTEWAVPPFYIYKKEDLPLIKDCLNHGCGFDAPGNLAHYLVERITMHAYVMPGTRIDIGDRETYEKWKGNFVKSRFVKN